MSYLFSALQCIAGTCRNRSLVLYLTVVLFLLWTGITFAGPAATGLTMEQRPGVKVLLRLDPVSHATRVRTRQTMTRDALRTKTATINVIYTGFTPEAEAAFQAAVDYWETMFVSSVPITVNASWEPLGTGVLGGAGATTFSRNFTNAPHANTWYSIALANTLAGQDMNGSANEIDATFSSAWTDWYFGTDGNPPSNQIDFMSAVMHELGHGLGMTAFFSKTGSFGYWGSSGSPAIYDEYVVNSSNTQLISMVSGSTTLGSQLTSNNLYWNGASGMLGNGGNKPKLYAPSSWATGSSISHLDETAYPAGNPNSLMTPLMGRGESIHDLGPIATGIFMDLGWPGMSIPTPQLPDLSLRPSTTSSYIGMGIYNLDGTGQTVSQAVAKNVKATYYVHIQNNGDVADTLTITGTAAPAGWTVEYRDYATNTVITSAVTGAGWSTGLLNSGAVVTMAVYVTPGATINGGGTATQTMTVTSVGDSTKQDVGVINTNVPVVNQPDVSLRPTTVTTYTGIGIYNLTGAGQTVSQSVAKNVKATYYVHVQNNGNAPEAFIITGTPAPVGWTVDYRDSSTSTVITSAVTGAGWTTPVVNIGAVVTIAVYVTPGSTVLGGAVASQTVTATSSGDGTKQDVGVINTTLPVLYQPDLYLRPSSTVTYSGIGVYNLDGTSQTVGLSVANTVTASYDVVLQNNGNVSETFILTAPAAPAGWTVVYSAGPTVITGAVTTTGWQTLLLAPAATASITVSVTPGSTVSSGAVATQTLTVTSNGDATKQDVGVIKTTVPLIYRPDVSLRPSTTSTYIGMGVYNLTGTNQTVGLTVVKGVKATYYVHIQNNGNVADTFIITGTPAPAGWTVDYKNYTTGTVITTEVTGAGWSTPLMNPNAVITLAVYVTPGTAAVNGSVATQTMTVTSSADATKQDVGVIKTTLPAVSKPDLYLRPSTVSTYSGGGIYNLDGTNQTVSQSVANGVKATYYVTVKNNGNVVEPFIITGSAAPAGWTVVYKTGTTVITSAVTTSGWTTPVKNPGTTVLITVYVTPSTTVIGGAMATQTVTVTSSADPTKQDVGVMQTTVPVLSRPDLYLRPSTVTTYSGSGIYNLDGTNQTVGQSVANNVKATYYVTVKNTGNVAGTFTINAPSAPSGWTVAYNQGATVITGAITAAGWTTPLLNPGATVLVTVYVTPGAAIPVSAVAEQMVTVTSTTDPSKQDVGVIQTTVM